MRVATPWIYSPKFDLAAIIGPPVVVTAVVLAMGNQLNALPTIPTWLWVVLVLGIDVSHVYSSLFRTYFDPEEFQKRRTLYLVVPAVCWLGGILLYATLGATFFWSTVAYLAIYHFVRQQYGFLMLYRRGEPTGTWQYRLDQVAIYAATLYPLLFWHTYGRDFQWFDNFEVVRIPSVWPELIGRVIYVAVLIGFLLKELFQWRSTGKLNLGKMLLLYATAAAWGTGILLFNGDLTFTLINIVSHGVPYMALVWIYQYRKKGRPAHEGNRFLRFFQAKYIPLYVLALFVLAYFEEGIWDKAVWKSQVSLFGPGTFSLAPLALMVLVPLLTMPQLTHYVLDAYIWRVNKQGATEVREVIG
jgi:hypothetical protein